MSTDLPKPDYARKMRILAHCDQGGRPDGVQIMVHRGFAYIGHMFSKGFSVIDVRDPKRPRAVNYLPAPPGTWNIHLQSHDDLLLVINAKDMFAAAEFADEKAYYKGQLGKAVSTADKPSAGRDWTAGLAVYEISTPQTPRRIAFMPVDGGGIHRIWYTGGPWAYVSALLDGFTDYIFMTVDMRDPSNPRETGRYCWGGRPPTASVCQNEVSDSSNKGAVREQDYSNWRGYVQECFSVAWSGCGGKAGAAQDAAAQPGA
jgi:hypothetical protein